MRSTITKDEVNLLPVRRYEGEVVLVSGPQALERAAADLALETLAGFDTETRPAFRPGESYLPSLVQIATGKAVYLFQVQRLNSSEFLKGVFERENLVKAGVSVADDLKGLKKVFPFEERSVIDVGALAKRAGYKQSGVRNLAALVLGFRIPKGAKTSNWAAATLTPQQVTYAATDAWACRELYLRLTAFSSASS